MLITILIILLALCLIVWLIRIAPTPGGTFPTATVKWFAIAIVVVMAIALIFGTAGIHFPG